MDSARLPLLCRLIAILGYVAALADARAVEAATSRDKSAYSLLNSTPVAALRELSTDRPDQTESPYTVDAGRFQLEMDFVNYTFDRERSAGGESRTRVLSLAPLNLKLGLRHNVDVQLMVEPQVEVRVEDRGAGTVARASGFGEVTTRVKVNFWGNDGGKTAFAMMPFVKWPLPTSALRNGKTEGGVIFPLGVELPNGWGMGLMTELDFLSDGGGGYDTEWVNSITFAHDLTPRLGGYVEFFAVTSRTPGFKWQGQLDVGFTYALREDVQLDFGCNFGVTKSAPDYQPFVGLSRRF